MKPRFHGARRSGNSLCAGAGAGASAAHRLGCMPDRHWDGTRTCRPASLTLMPDGKRDRWICAVAIAGLAVLTVSLVRPIPARGDNQRSSSELPEYPDFVRRIEPPLTAPSFLPSEPATRAARRLLAVVGRVRDSLVQTRYEHVTRVRVRQGMYLWDCSGMAAWMLKRSAPRALLALGSGRPVARDFHRVIGRAPAQRARNGWQRLAHIADARPGDVIAWVKPRGSTSRNTGHVAFLLETPMAVADRDGTWAVRIVDATSFGHQNDTRAPGSGGGYGEGTLLVLTDSDGKPYAYGWHGTLSQAVMLTSIVLGRLAG
jgi:hypothetical protein